MLIKRGLVVTQAKTGNIEDLDIKRRLVKVRYTAFDNEDSDGDIGTKGMTLKSVAESGPKSAQPRIKHFLNHDITQPLGVPQEMWEDNQGAIATSLIGTHAGGSDFLEKVDSGIITEHSYGLLPVRRDKSNPKRMLEVKVFEFSSLDAWGANPLTPILSTGKSMTKTDEIQHWTNKIAALEKHVRNSTAPDELLEGMLIEIKCISQRLIDLITTTPAVDKTQAAPGTQEDYTALLQSLQTIKF